MWFLKECEHLLSLKIWSDSLSANFLNAFMIVSVNKYAEKIELSLLMNQRAIAVRCIWHVCLL